MKKVITLCFFVFALLIGTQAVSAQTGIVEVNKKASKMTEALRSFIKFDDDQKDLVYEACQEYMQATLDLKQATVVEEGVREKINNLLDEKIKGILNEEQFARYKEFPKN